MKLFLITFFLFIGCSQFSAKHFTKIDGGRYQHNQSESILEESYGKYDLHSFFVDTLEGTASLVYYVEEDIESIVRVKQVEKILVKAFRNDSKLLEYFYSAKGLEELDKPEFLIEGYSLKVFRNEIDMSDVKSSEYIDSYNKIVYILSQNNSSLMISIHNTKQRYLNFYFKLRAKKLAEFSFNESYAITKFETYQHQQIRLFLNEFKDEL